MMDSDEEWNLDDDEEVVMPRELPKGCPFSICLSAGCSGSVCICSIMVV